MSRESCPLPSPAEVSEALEIPLDEAERLLLRMGGNPLAAQRERTRVRRPFSLIEALVVIALVGVVAAILFPVFARTRCVCYTGGCMPNVRQISIALLMYADDHEDQLPLATGWQDALSPYLRSSSLWVCSARKEQTPAYSYNALLHCRRINTLASPAEQPMLFESMMGRWNASDAGASFVAPHRGRGVVGYVDGHVKFQRSLPAADAGLVTNPVRPNRMRFPSDGR
jgi:prepilin-type processing-associated H-X9-DG protein